MSDGRVLTLHDRACLEAGVEKHGPSGAQPRTVKVSREGEAEKREGREKQVADMRSARSRFSSLVIPPG